MSRRKGTPCACECDPCGSKKYIKAINNVSPDPNGDFEVIAGNGIAISQSGDNQITVINDATASSFVAGDNIEINPSGDDLEIRITDNPVINGTLQVNGAIIQNDFHSQSYTVLGCTIWIWWNSKIAIISMRDQSISTTGSETINLPFTIRTDIIASIVSGSNYYGYVYSLDGTRLQVNFESTGLYAHFTVPTLIY